MARRGADRRAQGCREVVQAVLRRHASGGAVAGRPAAAQPVVGARRGRRATGSRRSSRSARPCASAAARRRAGACAGRARAPRRACWARRRRRTAAGRAPGRGCAGRCARGRGRAAARRASRSARMRAASASSLGPRSGGRGDEVLGGHAGRRAARRARARGRARRPRTRTTRCARGERRAAPPMRPSASRCACWQSSASTASSRSRRRRRSPIARASARRWPSGVSRSQVAAGGDVEEVAVEAAAAAARVAPGRSASSSPRQPGERRGPAWPTSRRGRCGAPLRGPTCATRRRRRRRRPAASTRPTTRPSAVRDAPWPSTKRRATSPSGHASSTPGPTAYAPCGPTTSATSGGPDALSVKDARDPRRPPRGGSRVTWRS